jgi:hypothetical protein
MLDSGFDAFARAVVRRPPAARSSRRTAMKALAAGALAGLLARSGTAGVAAGKVKICHRTGSASNPFVKMEIGEDAVAEHRAHGDVIEPDFPSDPERCDDCGNACDPGEICQGGTCAGNECDPKVDDCEPAGND